MRAICISRIWKLHKLSWDLFSTKSIGLCISFVNRSTDSNISAAKHKENCTFAYCSGYEETRRSEEPKFLSKLIIQVSPPLKCLLNECNRLRIFTILISWLYANKWDFKVKAQNYSFLITPYLNQRTDSPPLYNLRMNIFLRIFKFRTNLGS